MFFHTFSMGLYLKWDWNVKTTKLHLCLPFFMPISDDLGGVSCLKVFFFFSWCVWVQISKLCFLIGINSDLIFFWWSWHDEKTTASIKDRRNKVPKRTSKYKKIPIDKTNVFKSELNNLILFNLKIGTRTSHSLGLVSNLNGFSPKVLTLATCSVVSGEFVTRLATTYWKPRR